MNDDLHPSPLLRELIKPTEYNGTPPPYPYRDYDGNWTIGWGHLVTPEDDFSAGLSVGEMEALLDSDLESHAAVVRRLVTVPLDQGQFDALTDFVFNEGEKNLRESTLLTRLNSGDYGIADPLPPKTYATANGPVTLQLPNGEFGKWVWSKHHVQPGLITRRLRDARLWQTGDWREPTEGDGA